MKKDKLLLQSACCLMIALLVVTVQYIDNPKVSKVYQTVKTAVMKDLSKEDVKELCGQIGAVLQKVPAKTVAAVVEIHETSKYGQPIDEKTTTRIKQVHAVAGGKVMKSGYNDQYGLYIKIMHEEGISIYGNLATVNVVEAERIQRGEIIGSYDSLNEKEFYYELREDI